MGSRGNALGRVSVKVPAGAKGRPPKNFIVRLKI